MSRRKQAVPMSLEQYLLTKGCADVIDTYSIDKMVLPHGETYRQRDKRQQEALESSEAYHTYRNQCIAEYNVMVEKGEFRPLTAIENSLFRAHGHEDLASTQAARRMLTKRGIDWKTGRAIRRTEDSV